MKSGNTILVAIILIVLTGVVGAVAAPSQSATILSFTGGLAVMLVTLMREQAKTHDIVNSRLDEYKELIGAAERAKGVKAGREQMRAEREEDEKRKAE